MITPRLLLYIAVMAGVTYLIRMLPFTLMRRQITSRFLRGLLYYIPYAVLSAMTFPTMLYATGSMISAAAGTLAAIVLAYCRRSLLVVSLGASATALAVEMIIRLI